MSKAGETINSGADTAASISAMPYRKYFWLLTLAWTGVVAASLGWNFAHNQTEAMALTTRTAQALLEKDLLYREWSSMHGGVYIPSMSVAEPHINAIGEEREVVTPSGKRLTLLNPAVVSRQIFEEHSRQMGIIGRITSLDPIRPENKPDQWEQQAFKAFAAGAAEQSGVEARQGERYFRLMRPLFVTQSCLRCHEEQAHKPGDLRGGISVAVPMKQFTAQGENQHLLAAHAGLWSIGIFGLVIGLGKLEHHNRKRQAAEEQTRAALQEKEALLQEIHHRVKNNLQVVSSLLQLQCNEIEDPQTLAIFQESQLRIRSMALIHEKLYHADSLAHIDLDDYLSSLTNLLFSTYANDHHRVRLELSLTPISVSIDSAIPLGLIANELLTNCLKFAFPGGRPGVIRLELQSLPSGLVRFSVADDGVGLPKGFSIEQSKSLGLRLVRMLTQQLGAQWTCDTVRPGTCFSLEFRDKPHLFVASTHEVAPGGQPTSEELIHN